MKYLNKGSHFDDTLCTVFRSGINQKSKIKNQYMNFGNVFKLLSYRWLHRTTIFRKGKYDKFIIHL